MSKRYKDEVIANELKLYIVCDNAYDLAQNDNDSFILMRKNGFGASDSSILLGVNPWKKLPDLVKDKRTMQVTSEDKVIGQKESVRKGSDLEPLILKKFEQFSKLDCYKPDAMYRHTVYEHLTVDFDGLVTMGNTIIPVEAKFASRYALKYWSPEKSIDSIMGGRELKCAGANLQDHITQEAELYGIPVYYYTQLQHQMLMCNNAPFGYLAVLFEKDWEFKVFRIWRDDFAIEQLVSISIEIWEDIKEKRGEP